MLKRCTYIWGVLFLCAVAHAADPVTPSSTSTLAISPASSTVVASSSASLTDVVVSTPIRAIHLTASAAGSKRYRVKLDKMLADTIINAVIIDIKDEEGFVYVSGVKPAERAGAYARDIPDLPEWLAGLKKRGIYTVARLVTFKDNKLPRSNPSLGIHNAQGELWFDSHHLTWLDPYNREAWRYDLLVALRASEVGFDEIQFDYIRFPTDGNIHQIRYKKSTPSETTTDALVEFLNQARQLLHTRNVKISIDVFGLTTSVNTGMGIGQRMSPMAAMVDYVCPMTYPSHYAKGEYGIPIPNDAPYHVIHLAVRDALKALGPENAQKLRPYYQDFSLKGRGKRYGPAEVRAQIQAAVDLGVPSWTLWNASCHYTVSALTQPFTPGPIPASLITTPQKPPEIPAKPAPKHS